MNRPPGMNLAGMGDIMGKLMGDGTIPSRQTSKISNQDFSIISPNNIMSGPRGTRIGTSPLMPTRSLFTNSSQNSFNWGGNPPRFGGI